jgi:hypothetical protein
MAGTNCCAWRRSGWRRLGRWGPAGGGPADGGPLMGISAASFYPGNIASSFGTQSQRRIHKFVTTNPIARRLMLTTPEKGAEQLVRLAEGRPGVDWQSDTYYKKGKPAKSNAQADDADLIRRFWDRSEQLLALPTR